MSLLLSSAVLILMPKCPVCVATYLALLTGISLSTAAAGHVRMVLIIVCIGTLVILAWAVLGRIHRPARRFLWRPFQRRH